MIFAGILSVSLGCFWTIVQGSPPHVNQFSKVPTISFSFDPRHTISDYIRMLTQGAAARSPSKNNNQVAQVVPRNPVMPSSRDMNWGQMSGESRSFSPVQVNPHAAGNSLISNSGVGPGPRQGPLPRAAPPVTDPPTTTPPPRLSEWCNQHLPNQTSRGNLETNEVAVQNALVEQHNCLRRLLPSANMMKMSWDQEAAENAKAWASLCQFRIPTSRNDRKKYLLSTNDFHFTDCAQNVAAGYASWSEAVKEWYDQVRHFAYGYGALNAHDTIHYTTIASAKTHTVGCAVANCIFSEISDDPINFFVCQYCPGGNYGSNLKMPYEQGLPCSSCPNACEDGLCTSVAQ